jgi:hypothetical protein
MTQWQDISTAPKDGSTYLILRCERPKHTCIGVWHEDRWKPIHSVHDVYATYWMPIPSPPIEGKAE